MIIKESNNEIERLILTSLVKKINTRISKNINRIQIQLIETNLRFFKHSDTYQALTIGDLKLELGFPAGQEFQIADAIVVAAANSVKVRLDPFKVGNNITGGLSVSLIRSDFFDLLSLSEANIDIEGGQIPWLEWLLTQGDQILVSDYSVIYKDAGRSEGAIMIPKPGSFWKMPTEYAGTSSDNWFTRIVSSKPYLDSLGNIIEKNI
jgi:hypothetical protein